MFVVDDQRRYVAVNSAACELLEAEAATVVGRTIDDLTAPADHERLAARWADFRARGCQVGTFTLTRTGGDSRFTYYAVADWEPGRHVSMVLPVDCGARTHNAGLQARVADLTPREAQVLGLVAAGLETRAIAEQLVISYTTVETHVRNAMRRLGAHTRAHAVALAILGGALDGDPAGLRLSAAPRADGEVADASDRRAPLPRGRAR